MTATATVVHAGFALLLTAWIIHDRAMLRDSPASRWLWATLLGLAIAQASYVPALYFTIDRLGIGWGQVVRNLAAIGAATGVLLINDHTFARSTGTRRLHGLAGTLAAAACVLPWVIDPPTARPAALDGPHPFYYDDTWRSLVHWSAFLLILGWSLASCTWQEAAASRDITDPHARVAARLVATGTGIGLTYVAAHAVAVLAWQTGHGHDQVAWEKTADVLTLAPSLATIIVGVLWARLRHAADDARTRRDLRLLKHHWTHLVAVIPEVSPWPHATARPAHTREQLHWQRSRLTTEIHDAGRALVALIPEPVQDRVATRVAAAGLRGHHALAVTEHLCLQLAIQARRDGRTITSTGREPRLYADDCAQAAREIARRLRVVHRRRIQHLIQHVLQESNAPDRPPTRPQPQDALP